MLQHATVLKHYLSLSLSSALSSVSISTLQTVAIKFPRRETRDETMNPLSTPLLRGIPPAASKYLKVHLTHRKDPQFNCSREDGPHVNLGSIVCKFYLSFGFALKCDPTRELLNEASFSATKKAI